MTKSKEDLDIKTNALNAELEKAKVSEVQTKTVYELNKVSDVKKERKMKITLKKTKLKCFAGFFIQEKDAGEKVSAGFPIVKIIRHRRKVKNSN